MPCLSPHRLPLERAARRPGVMTVIHAGAGPGRPGAACSRRAPASPLAWRHAAPEPARRRRGASRWRPGGSCTSEAALPPRPSAFEEGRAFFARGRHAIGEVSALLHLGAVRLDDGDLAGAESTLRTSLVVAEQAGWEELAEAARLLLARCAVLARPSRRGRRSGDRGAGRISGSRRRRAGRRRAARPIAVGPSAIPGACRGRCRGSPPAQARFRWRSGRARRWRSGTRCGPRAARGRSRRRRTPWTRRPN